MPLAVIHWKALYRLQSCQSLAKNNDWLVLANPKVCLLPNVCFKMLQDAVGCAHSCLEKDWNGFLISYYSFLQLEWHLQYIYVWQAMLLCCLQWDELLQDLETQHLSKLQCCAVNFSLQGKTNMESGGTLDLQRGYLLFSCSLPALPPPHLLPWSIFFAFAPE